PLVRQMQILFLRLEHGIEEREPRVLEHAKIDDLGQHPLLPKDLQDLAPLGFGVQPFRLQAPEMGVGAIEELQPPIRTEGGDARAEQFEHLGMSLDVPSQLCLNTLHRREIERMAGKKPRILTERDLVELEEVACAADHE